MKRISFSSVLSVQYREDLEAVLFFSPHQDRVREGILKSIRQYGTPAIIVRDGLLRIVVGEYADAQTLYALEEDLLRPRVVGSIIYIRNLTTNLTIVHVAVAPEYVMVNNQNSVPLAVQLFTKVMEAARQIKGIETVTVLYGKGHQFRMPILTQSTATCLRPN